MTKTERKAEALRLLETLDILGYRECDIKQVLNLAPRDPVVWRWRTGRQSMRLSTIKMIKKEFGL